MHPPAAPDCPSPSVAPDSAASPAAAAADDVARVTTLGQRALQRIKSHGLAPTPVNYEVWFTYFCGHHKALNHAIDSMEATTAAALQRVYDEFLSPNRFLARVHRVTDSLRGEASNLVCLIEQASESSSEYHDSLVGVSRSLGPHNSHVSIESVIAELTRSTNEVMRTNALLQEQLKKSEAQVQALHASLEQVQTESITDPLTATLNRAAFDRAFATLTARAEQTSEPLCLVLIDIDHFKNFNDRHGHLVGDDVLRLAALVLKHNVRDSDVVARLGGDEFAVILPRTSLITACTVAERIRLAVTERQVIRRSTHEALGRMSVSIGIAQFVDGSSPEDVIQRADSNLYAAKRAGRDRIVAEPEPAGV